MMKKKKSNDEKNGSNDEKQMSLFDPFFDQKRSFVSIKNVVLVF